MMHTGMRVGSHIIIFSIFLMILMGNKGISPAWELDKSSMKGERINTASIDYQKPLPGIEELRRRIKEKGYNFTVDETWVYRLSPEESDALFGTVPMQIDERRLKKIPHMAGLPSYFDWRDRNMVTPVKEQYPCGLCWAFTAVAEFESKILINEGISYDFSEQNLASCDYMTSTGIAQSCSTGGNPFRSTNFFTQQGVSLESCAPFMGMDGTPCKDACDIIKSIDGWQMIADDVDTIKAVLYQYGPVATSMFASDPALKAYTGGVYELDDAVMINHAVLIVGWDDSLGPEGAWIVKNSWGTDWGMGGYFYIAYGAANIGTMSSYITSYKNHDADETILYYDEGGFARFDIEGNVIDMSSIGAGLPTAWCASIFTPGDSGILNAVDFWTTSSNAFYEIRIYDQMVDGAMQKILSRQFGRCENIGYYSIPLTRPVTVTASDDFVVAIKLTTPGYNFPIPVDITTGPKESGLCYLSVNGTSWVPIGEGTTIPYDVAIRARITKGDVSRWPEVYEIMFNENGDDDLSLLRRFRDEALELQTWGKRWVQLLYNNSEEIANLMLEDPLLTAEVGKIIDQLIPVVQSYLENKEMKLSVEQLDSILILLSCFESKASLGLKRVISTFRSDLSRREMLSQRGIIVD